MKRLSTSDSSGGLEGRETAAVAMPISPSEEEIKGRYGERFGAILEGLEEGDCEEEEVFGNGSTALGEKKRRLSVEQVKALEKNFEVENKLDPERKSRLAQDLGLQPRQVAVWFQNRRARWKTKQLERDYGALRARYDALKLDCDALRRDKDGLLAEIRELKAKLASTDQNKGMSEERPAALIYKVEGASDSDSSVVFNEEQQYQMMGFKSSYDCSSSSPLFEDRSAPAPAPATAPAPHERGGFFYHDDHHHHHHHHHQQQQQQLVVGMEEVMFLRGEEEEPAACSNFMFSEEQAPSLSWYCNDGWES